MKGERKKEINIIANFLWFNPIKQIPLVFMDTCLFTKTSKSICLTQQMLAGTDLRLPTLCLKLYFKKWNKNSPISSLLLSITFTVISEELQKILKTIGICKFFQCPEIYNTCGLETWIPFRWVDALYFMICLEYQFLLYIK